MTEDQIQRELNRLSNAVMARSYKMPGATVLLRANVEPALSIDAQDSKYEFIASPIYWAKGKNISELIADADHWLADQPDPETLAMHDFMTALGKVIDMGRDNGIDVDFLNPLTATMKRLSENVITDQRRMKDRAPSCDDMEDTE
jgi:hypothetical protein